MAETAILALSLKEYKKQIDDLKGSLLGLEKGSKEYQSILTEVRNRQTKLNEVMADSKRTSDVAANSMNALKAQLKEMKQEAGNLDIGSSRFKELTIQINETTEKLKDLEAQQGTFSRNVGNYESGVVSLKGQLKEITAQMAQMLDSGVKPTDAAFVELAKKAGDLKDAIADSQAVIKHFADDTKGLSTVIDLAKTGTAAFGVYKGALSLFGIENESVNQTMATMTTVMATLNSLQTLQTALVDRASITYRLYNGVIGLSSKALAFLGLTSKQTAASTVAETTATAAHTTAMVADTAATGAATVATNLFRKALIATGIGAIVVLIGTLISYWDDLVGSLMSAVKWIGKVTGLIKEQTAAEKVAAAAEKRHREELDELAKKEKELNATNVELMTTFEKLKAIWDSLSTLEDRRKFVEQYKNEMSALGVEINNVNDAEKFFSKDGTEAFAKSIEIRAKLALKQQALMQKIRREEELVAQQAMGDALYKIKQEKQAILDEIVDLSNQLNKYTPKTTSKTTTTTTKSTSTKKETKEDTSGNIEALERYLDEQTKLYQYQYDMLAAMNKARLEDEIETLNKIHIVEVDTIQKMIDDREKQLENTKITAEQRKQIEDEIYKYRQELNDKQNEYEIESEKLRIKLAQERLANIKKEAEQEAKMRSGFDELTPDARIKKWLDEIKNLEPEVAKAYIETLAPSYLQEEILQIYDDYQSGRIDNIMEWEMREEQLAYDHAMQMVQVAKNALQEITINFGEGSDEYLAQEQIVFQMEEEATERHYKNLAKIQDKHSKETKKKNKQTMSAFLDMGQGIGDIFSTVGSIMEDDIRNKQENGKISEEEAKKQFETVKNMQIAAATVNMLSGAVGAYMQATQTYPPPYGPILGGINAALATAMGIAQIAQIKNQQYGSSGSVSSATGAAATREAVNVDFSSVSVNPLLDEQADINRLTTLSESQQTDQRVYILQSDIADSQKQVQVRQTNTTF